MQTAMIDRIGRAFRFAGEAVAETLWPTRCAVCDTPGAVLCESCRAQLPHVDYWRACRRCGAPFGLVQCDFCNPVMLGRLGCSQLPFASCASAVSYDGETGQIVRVFKDQGEQRLAAELAREMAYVVPPSWAYDAITFVPATLAAIRLRGYDHAELLARSLALLLGTDCVSLLNRPVTRDQRKLTVDGRIANLANSFAVTEGRSCYRNLILVDDVFTTGATLCAASRALAAAGSRRIQCLTFARV